MSLENDSFTRIRQMVRDLRANPADRDTALVLADWATEHGFHYASSILTRNYGNTPGFELLEVLSGFHALFGHEGQNDVLPKTVAVAGKYSGILGFRPTEVPPAAVVHISAQTQVFFRLRRLVISANPFPASLEVNDVRVGNLSFLLSSDSVPAEHIFGPTGPDLFNAPVHVSQFITIVVTNMSGGTVIVGGCALGDCDDLNQRPGRNVADEEIIMLKEGQRELRNRVSIVEDDVALLKNRSNQGLGLRD